MFLSAVSREWTVTENTVASHLRKDTASVYDKSQGHVILLSEFRADLVQRLPNVFALTTPFKRFT